MRCKASLSPIDTHLAQNFGAALCGDGIPDGFPFLVKLIDAAQDLSVQVHPGKDLHDDERKDESWILLRADTKASLIHGFNGSVSREQLGEALAHGDPMPLFRQVPVTAGTIVRVPPGTVHAIGAGILLLEVQDPMPRTYRLWDYARRGLDGNPRELHVEQALRAIDWTIVPSFSSLVLCLRTAGVTGDFSCRHLAIVSKIFNFQAGS